MGGLSPCNTDAIFIVFNISFSSAMPQGSWYLHCMVFPRQYRAVVHWIRGPSSVSESRQITLLSLLFELSSCAWLTCAMLLVWDVARHGISTPFLKMFFSFQILVLSYEPFISLPFFSHYPGDDQSHEEKRTKSDQEIIFCLQTMLDLFASRVHPPWTLSGLCYDGQHSMGILNTRQGEVCMVAPPLLDVHSYFFHSIRFPLDHPTCDDFPKLAHSSQTLYLQLSRMVQLTPFVQTKPLIFFSETYWILDHFNFNQEWFLLELFCIQSFKGVTPRGRHTRPACN